MGLRRVLDGSVMDLRQFAGERAQYCRCAISRAMICQKDLITKGGDIAHRGFNKIVLVADKDDSDNARRAQTRSLPWTSTQSHCRSRSMRMIARKLCRRRKTTSSLRSHEIASNGPPPSSMLIPMS